jgi:hypothetical protein
VNGVIPGRRRSVNDVDWLKGNTAGVAIGFGRLRAGPLRENLVMDQEQGATSGWRSGRLESGVSGACCIDGPGGYERTVMGLPAAGGRDPYGIVAVGRKQLEADPGSKRGASDRRWWAVPGDVRRMKLLVRRHVATVGYWLGSYGMQEVRGSNPRSSTSQLKAIDSNGIKFS